MPAPPPAPPRAPPRPRPHKSVSFCACRPPARALHPPCARDDRYYSDPGRDAPAPQPRRVPPADSADSVRYYSEPDAKNYFEIDYQFLKELRKIAKNNCPKCKRKRRKAEESKQRTQRSRKESYVFCNGRYHSDQEHCRLCCRVCSRSTDTLDSIDDEYSLVSRSYSQPSKATSSSTSRSKSTPVKPRERKNSVQSIKSVSFLESSNDESKDETNYTAKSFTNDLKKFLLKPSAPRQSLRDKFMSSIKQEFEAKKKSPKLKAIKGLWKSY